MATQVDDVHTYETPSAGDIRNSFTSKGTSRLIKCGYISLVCCLGILPSLVYFGMRSHMLNLGPMILNTFSFFILMFGALLTLAMALTKKPWLTMASYVDVVFSVLISFSMFAGNLGFAQMDLIFPGETTNMKGFLYFNVILALVNMAVKVYQGVTLSVMLGRLAHGCRRPNAVVQVYQSTPSAPPQVVNIPSN